MRFVSNSSNLWQAYRIAREFRCRPSELYDVTDPIDAFKFDRAVYVFGSSLSAALDSAEGKNEKAIRANRKRIIQKWIPEAAGDARTKAKNFRDPARASSF